MQLYFISELSHVSLRGGRLAADAQMRERLQPKVNYKTL